MWRRAGSALGWRECMAPLQQEVLQQGSASLRSIAAAISTLAAAAAANPAAHTATGPGVADGLVVIAQQLTHTTRNKLKINQQLITQQLPDEQTPEQQQQQEQEVSALLKACCSYCELTSTVLSAPAEQQQQQHTKFRRQAQPQQQPQQAPQQLLPSQAATAVCCCLRQWADMHQGQMTSSSSAEVIIMQGRLQVAAGNAIAALLPQQLPVLAVHERAAVLTLLQSMAQPRPAACGSLLSSSGGGTVVRIVQQEQGQQQQDHSLEVSQAAVQTLGQLCRKASSCGLSSDEHSNITRVLVDALTASCCSTGSISGSGGSSSRGTSSGGSNSGSGGSNRLPEDAQHAKYYAALLIALQYAVTEDKQGLQSFAASITEAARKLFTYGTHQQPQQEQNTADGAASTQVAPAATSSAPSAQDAAVPAVATMAHTTAASGSSSSSSTPASSPFRYRPPHMRGAAVAAAPDAASAAQQQQQDAFGDTESYSEWSDTSDSEQGPSRRSSRDSSSARRRQQQQQQQQALLLQQDPIRAYCVRVALMQLLQALAQADAKLMHPYLSVLLPSQQPLQARPLSPHLLTVLLYDPCSKVRLLAAALLVMLLEGPAARALLAVAEARAAPRGAVRGFTTVSMSLGHMLLALHTGLLAAVQAARQPQQQQQGQEQQQDMLVPSGSLLCSLLRVLSVLVAVAPYDRLPSHLLPDVVGGTYGLWQHLQQLEASTKDAPAAAAAAAGAGVSLTAGSSSALAPEDVPAATAAAVTVLAQALSTKKPSAGLAAWLDYDKAAAAAAAAAAAESALTASQPIQQAGDATSGLLIPCLALPTSSSTCDGMSARQTYSGSSSSRTRSLVASLLAAAVSPRPLLRIEALAALRGCCINYPAALPGGTSTPSSSSSSNSSSSDAAACSWAAVLAAVQFSLAATQQVPRTPRGTPVANGSSSSKSGSSSDEVSASTSPEDKAAQHAVKLIGDWLAAAWKLEGLQDSSSSTAAAARVATGTAAAQPDSCTTTTSSSSSSGDSCVASSQKAKPKPLVQLWGEALELLLSDQLQHHPSYMIRSAAAAVTADIPAPVWQALPAALQQQVLDNTARAAQADSVAAARAAACKVLGSLVLLPGMLAVERQQQLLQLLLAPLGKCVRDSTVSVRLSASWAVASACDALKAACGSSSSSNSSPLDGAKAAAPSVSDASCRCAVAASALQLLCQASLAAAGDSEKVRANGIRAVGALLAGWQPEWGVTSSSGSSGDAASTADNAPSSAPSGPGACATAQGCGSANEVLPWLPGWLRSAVGQLQSCLASRSPKVVWNAAYAAAGLLQNRCLHARAEVCAAVPSLLLVLIVLVRDSSNFKIKTHAAAALAAVSSRQGYGECYADAVLVLLAALDSLEGNSSSSSTNEASGSGQVGSAAAAAAEAAAGAGTDDDGSFPNFKYIPGLAAQLQASLLHLLSLLQQSDVARLKEPLQRRKQQLLQLVARAGAAAAPAVGAAATAAAAGKVEQLQEAAQGMNIFQADGIVKQQQQQQQQQQYVLQGHMGGARAAAAAAATCDGAQGQLPSDPFSQDGSWRSSSSFQKPPARASSSLAAHKAANPASSAAAAADSVIMREQHLAVAGALHGLSLVLGPIS